MEAQMLAITGIFQIQIQVSYLTISTVFCLLYTLFPGLFQFLLPL